MNTEIAWKYLRTKELVEIDSVYASGSQFMQKNLDTYCT